MLTILVGDVINETMSSAPRLQVEVDLLLEVGGAIMGGGRDGMGKMGSVC